MISVASSIKILSPGLLSTIQDNGRFGLRHLGIPWAGALCPAWLSIANALVGNPSNAPAIECFEGGLIMQALEHDVHLSIVGCDKAVVQLEGKDHKSNVKLNRSFTLAAGYTLKLASTGNYRFALIAIAGIELQQHLGSVSTYAKASLGGLHGSILQADDEIQTRIPAEHHSDQQCQLPDTFRYEASELRVIAGPQFEHFSSSGIDTFLSAPFKLGTEADRMGVRLNGPVIEHLNAASKNIVSDAIVPGSIQVPGTGQPIVLLNDAHTAGGYPKIATVISADLPLLGVQRPGAQFTFSLIDINEAIVVRNSQRKLIEDTIAAFSPCIRSELDTKTLLENNLIDGVTDGSDANS